MRSLFRNVLRRARAGWLTRRGLAVAALIFNLPFVAGRAQRMAYDTYPHIFLADHYRQHWWQLWEPRWYLGFSVASYPPLTHQLIALLSWPLGLVFGRLGGEEAAFGLVLLAALVGLPLAVREFAGLFSGPRAAQLAGGLAILAPGVSLAAWSFGQLPTLAASGAALLALSCGLRYARQGGGRRLAQAVALAALTGSLHHAVFLFLPFAGLAAFISGRRRLTAAVWLRLAVWVGLSGLAVALVLWPFLQWSRGQAMQTPIDHLSRHNFFTDPAAAQVFFFPVYGWLTLAWPWALVCAWRWPRFRPLGAAALALGILGLGGSTPAPRWLFGAGWAWLTYDRFALWAALLLLPFAAVAGLLIWRRRGRWRRAAYTGLAVLIASAMFSGWHAVIYQTQPPPVDLAALARFLDAPARRPYRYLTLGFGDQMAALAALTENGTPDGDYHTARQLPELRASGLGAIDTALWTPQGAWAAQPFLEQARRYGARWLFIAHADYLPVAVAAGWQLRTRLGGVVVAEYPGVKPVPAAPDGTVGGRWAGAWWGSAPLASLALAIGIGLAPRARAAFRRRRGGLPREA